MQAQSLYLSPLIHVLKNPGSGVNQQDALSAFIPGKLIAQVINYRFQIVLNVDNFLNLAHVCSSVYYPNLMSYFINSTFSVYMIILSKIVIPAWID